MQREKLWLKVRLFNSIFIEIIKVNNSELRQVVFKNLNRVLQLLISISILNILVLV